ncbi:MAG: hypothetical protein QF632_01830 [Candidatus Woesearchaeota archaeon]|nr:hypothetical protein [Candidatus Woesearchaeota archaeon]MDP7457573.1 hypothetical protein [Candidatus Woesearchaeota archaeon]
MKQYLIILISIMLLSACSFLVEKEDDSGLKDGILEDLDKDPVILTSEKAVEVRPNATEEKKEPPRLNPEVTELLSKRARVRSIVYRDIINTKDKYYILGNKALVELNKKRVIGKKIYNKVIVDLDTGEEFGYCTDTGFCGPRDRSVYYEVEYNNYSNAKNPLAIPDSWIETDFKGPTRIQDKSEVRDVAFLDDKGKSGIAVIDIYYGLPNYIQYYISENEITIIEFLGLEVNTVSEEDLEIPEGLLLSTIE